MIVVSLAKLISISESVIPVYDIEGAIQSIDESTADIEQNQSYFNGLNEGVTNLMNSKSLNEAAQYELLNESILSTIIGGVMKVIRGIIDGIANIIDKITGNKKRFQQVDNKQWIAAAKSAEKAPEDRTFQIELPVKFYDKSLTQKCDAFIKCFNQTKQDFQELERGVFDSMGNLNTNSSMMKDAKNELENRMKEKNISEKELFDTKKFDDTWKKLGITSDNMFKDIMVEYLGNIVRWADDVNDKNDLREKMMAELEGEKEARTFRTKTFEHDSLHVQIVNFRDRLFGQYFDAVEKNYHACADVLRKLYDQCDKYKNMQVDNGAAKVLKESMTQASQYISTVNSIMNVVQSAVLTALNDYYRYSNYVLNTWIASVNGKKTEAKEPEKK